MLTKFNSLKKYIYKILIKNARCLHYDNYVYHTYESSHIFGYDSRNDIEFLFYSFDF